jgi:hypothetical protein
MGSKSKKCVITPEAKPENVQAGEKIGEMQGRQICTRQCRSIREKIVGAAR